MSGLQSIDELITSLRAAARGADAQPQVDALLSDALKQWDGLPPWMEEPDEGRFELLHGDSEVTIMNIVWPRHMIVEPHTHKMWASVAIYMGRENNVLWEREGDSIVPVGANSVTAGEVCSFPADAIHSVHNPVDGLTGAIHVYGGDFINTANSEWDPIHLNERPRNMDLQKTLFARS